MNALKSKILVMVLTFFGKLIIPQIRIIFALLHLKRELTLYTLYIDNVVPFRNNIANTDVQIVVLDSNGDIISSSSVWSQPMIPVSMSKNERYFVRIISWMSKPLTYQFHICYM